MKRNWRLHLPMELCCLGQNELADLAGVDKAAVNRIISGQKKASPRQEANLVQVLEQRLSNLTLDSSVLFEA
jgi:plasmid maintenance system antidote protein VapI